VGKSRRLAARVSASRNSTGTLEAFSMGMDIRKAPVRRKTRKNICSWGRETERETMG
jgi:hypothetical protein